MVISRTTYLMISQPLSRRFGSRVQIVMALCKRLRMNSGSSLSRNCMVASSALMVVRVSWYEFYAQENINYFKLNVEGEQDCQCVALCLCGLLGRLLRCRRSGSAYGDDANYSRWFAPAFCN